MAIPSLFLASALLVALLFCHATAASQQLAHDVGCVHLPIIHSTKVDHFSDKRGIQVQLANRSDVAYYAQLSIGTPPQPVYVQVDTGSFELWVNPDCTTVSGSDAVFCERAGRYDASESSTATSLGTSRTLRYGIGAANISYFTDNISLAGSAMALQDVQFGVATSSEDAFSGILGIGYGKGIGTGYPNFVDQLWEQNVTRVKAYTLALGNKDSEEGVIVFGGVDTSKFAGRLARLPVIPRAQSPDGVPRFWVEMKSLSLTRPNGLNTAYDGASIPVFLDSGSTMTLLPANLTTAIARDFGAQAPDASGFYRIDCALAALNGTLDFVFDGVTVKVPYKELTREVASDPPSCFLGIVASDRFTLLGDTFLRSAYTVFDLETDSIWMAQAANCGSSPAALSNVRDLSAVIGECGISETAESTSSTQVPSTGADDTEAGPPHTSTTTVASQPSETTTQIGGSSSRGSAGNRLGAHRLASFLAIMAALHLFTGI